MGQAIPRQQPAVPLRSRLDHVRALIVVALVAVGLIVAIAILASDTDQAAGTSATEATGSPSTRVDDGNSGDVSLRAALSRPGT
jgi:hypothetical protein